MGIFRKQTARAPLTTVLLVLLLALSIAASSIGFAAWTGANKQFEEIDSQYTTIGIHAGLNYDQFFEAGHAAPIRKDSTQFESGLVYTGILDAMDWAEESPAYRGSSKSVLLSAHVEGMTGLTSGTMDILQYNQSHDSNCYNLAVFAIECLSVERDAEPFIWDGYDMQAKVLDNVCLMDAYDLPPEQDVIQIDSYLFTPEGEIPFEVGKTYLVRGRYWDYTIDDLGYQTVTDEAGNEMIEFIRGRDIEYGFRQLIMEGQGDLVDGMSTPGRAEGVQNFIYDIHEDPDTGLIYFSTPKNGCWPYFAEYDGDWRDFLASDDGRVWREEIIPNFEMNHASAPVILTDNIDSLYLFNTGDASVMEGRTISETEYQKGDAVCLVSASYAKLNGLNVGDAIHLDYYNTGYEQSYMVISSIRSQSTLTIERKPLMDNTRMNVSKDYEIVGIYSSPEWTPGVQNFHADTIFVPKASVPGANKITTDMDILFNTNTISMLNTITIKNGSIDEFEAHMAENDMAGVYLYFDQGYTEAAATVQTLIDNAMRLMLVGVAMFLLASMLFLLLFARRVSAVMRSMRLLGVPKRKTWLESLGMLVMQELIAVLLGNGLAVILYDRITAQLLSGTPALDPVSIALCAGVQLAVLVAAGGIWMHRIAGSNLMQKSEGGKLLWNKNKAASCGA